MKKGAPGFKHGVLWMRMKTGSEVWKGYFEAGFMINHNMLPTVAKTQDLQFQMLRSNSVAGFKLGLPTWE